MFANDEAKALVERGLHCAARLHGATKARLDIGLLHTAIYADAAGRRSTALKAAMEHAIVVAESFGCTAEVARGLNALSYLHFERGDFGSAMTESLRAQNYARGADPAQALRAIAHAAQCLALLERELPRAEALTAEAERLSTELGTEVAELHLAHALMRYHRGEVTSAVPLLLRALELATQRDQHWLEALCLTRLVMSALHAGRPQAAIEHCEQLRAVAVRMGEASEGPLSAALAAVARRDMREPEAAGALHAALERLRELDAQAYLAETHCFAAEAELRAGDAASARKHASAALTAASVGGRPSSLIWAHALLARVAIASGDPAAARAQLAIAEPLLAAQPYANGLAQQHIAAAEGALKAAQ